MDALRPITESEKDASKSSTSANGTGSDKLLCTNCGENEPMGDQLKANCRKDSRKLLALRRGLCKQCLQQNDARVQEGQCGFLDCSWKYVKERYTTHWERHHALKTFKCDYSDCSSTVKYNPATP